MRIPGTGSYYDARQHLVMLNMLSVFDGSNAGQVFTARFRSLFESGDQVTYVPGSPSCPAFIVVQGSTGAVILVDGMRTLGQAGWFVDNTPRFSQDWITSRNFAYMHYAPAVTIAAAFTPALAFYADHVWIVGYSWGGAIGKCVEQLLGERLRATQERDGWFYGAMRSMRYNTTFGTVQGNYVDMWTLADPIPRFPTHAREAPLQLGILGIPRTQYWSQLIQPRNGVTPGVGGTITPILPGTQPIATGELRLANWMLGGALLGNANHSIQSYIDACSFEDSSGGGDDFEPNVIVQAMPETPPTPTVVRSAINAGVRQQRIYAEANPQAVLNQVLAAVVRGRPDRVHRNSYRGSHVVTYQGEILAVTGSKRQAKKIVREANRQLGFK